MSNNRKTFTLTDAATLVIETIPSNFRAKFVSDAIVALSKKKGITEEYNITKSGVANKNMIESKQTKTSSETNEDLSVNKPKKSKSDPRF